MLLSIFLQIQLTSTENLSEMTYKTIDGTIIILIFKNISISTAVF